MNNFKHDIKGKGGRERTQALLLTAAGAALLAALPLNRAAAEEMNASDYILPDMAPVSDAELDGNRGGFSIGNVNISFGITVTTAISGPSMNPINVTTNFNVETPGTLTNLGTKITNQVQNQVQNTLADAGIGDSKSDAAPKTITQSAAATGGAGTQYSVQLSPPPPPAVAPKSDPTTVVPPVVAQNATPDVPTSDNTPDTPNTPAANQLASNDLQPDNSSGFKAAVGPNSSSVIISNGAGTNVAVDTAHGIVTTITNTLSDMSFKTQVDLNYAINNYADVVKSSQSFQQAMSLAQQMLAIHGIAGH